MSGQPSAVNCLAAPGTPPPGRRCHLDGNSPAGDPADQAREHAPRPDLDERVEPVGDHALDQLDPAHRRVHLPDESVSHRAGRPSPAPHRRCCTAAPQSPRRGAPPAPAPALRAPAAISGEWNGADTGSGTTRLAPRAVRSSPARATAPAWPAITVCSGALKLAATTVSAAALASGSSASTRSRPGPSTADIAPTPTGTASCMSWPRRRTVRTRSSTASPPAAPTALYSPREWPATPSNFGPARRQDRERGERDRQDRRLGVGGEPELPRRDPRSRAWREARRARRRRARTPPAPRRTRSARSLPMPANWLP